MQDAAKRYEDYLKANWQPGTKQGRELQAEGNRLLAAGTDFRAASRAFAQAVVFDGNDAQSWLGLARALLAIKSDQGGERYELPINASGAAWYAYERAQSPAAKAAALWVLHEAFKRRSYWRPAIDALKASIALNRTAEARGALEKLVAEYGFRIAEYKVDTEAAQPRLCIQFSERLAPGTVDWCTLLQGRRQGPAGGKRRGAPDLPRRLRPRQALRGAGARRAAVGASPARTCSRPPSCRST